MKLYGLKNCDTCRKALKWLRDQNLDVEFIDVRGDQITRSDIERFIASFGHETVLNRKSATWRSLSPDQRTIVDDRQAAELAARYPTLLKRPVIEVNGELLIGFTAAVQKRLAEFVKPI